MINLLNSFSEYGQFGELSARGHSRRLPSTKNYYPTIEELLEADNDDVTRVFNDMTKTSLMCIGREILSQV